MTDDSANLEHLIALCREAEQECATCECSPCDRTCPERLADADDARGVE